MCSTHVHWHAHEGEEEELKMDVTAHRMKLGSRN
jgi:hypothetical protein